MHRCGDWDHLHSRRSMLRGLAAAAAFSLSPMTNARAAKPNLPAAIDVHHHILPPFYKPIVEPWLNRHSANMGGVIDWTPERSLAVMDQAGVERAVLSLSTPGVGLGAPEDGVALARRCNDFSAELASGHAGRFQFFAAMPLPNVEEALIEAARALDALRAAGIGLLSSYDGRYLGDPLFAPLFDELNRRGAIVYVHPTMPNCCVNVVPGVMDTLIEFPVDTARSVASLLWSGTLSRCPNIRFIFSHGAGVLPMVIERVSALGRLDAEAGKRVPDGAEATLSRLYVDTASVANPVAMAALRAWLPDERILYGTDYPWGNPGGVLEGLDAIGLPAATLAAIRRHNALKLLPPVSPP